MKKKCLLFMMMLLCFMFVPLFDANADELAKSKEEAIAWLENMSEQGKSLQTTTQGKGKGLDLAEEYYCFLSNYNYTYLNVWGNLAPGFMRIKNEEPLPGDICIASNDFNNYYMWVKGEGNITYHCVISDGNYIVEKSRDYKNEYFCEVIRPIYKPTALPAKPVLSISTSTAQPLIDESINVSWSWCEDASEYFVYYEFNHFDEVDPAGRTTLGNRMEFGFPEEGDYTFYVKAINSLGATLSDGYTIRVYREPEPTPSAGRPDNWKATIDKAECVVGEEVTVSWGLIPEADNYEIVIYQNNDFVRKEYAAYYESSIKLSFDSPGWYLMEVYSDNIEFYYEFLGEVTVYVSPKSLPGAPNVSLSCSEYLAGGTAYLNWSDCYNAKSYKVLCYRDGEKHAITDCERQSTGYRASVYFDEPGDYRITVAAVNSEGVTEGNWIEFTVSPMTIKKQPVNQTVKSGASAEFRIVVEGIEVNYQWQVKLEKVNLWANVKNQNKEIFPVTYNEMYDKMKVRCVVTDKTGKKIISKEAILKYEAHSISITAHPDDVSTTKETMAEFRVNASGSSLKYQWQFQLAGKTTWTDWTGKTTRILKVGYDIKKNNMKVRCRITDSYGNTKTSNEAVVTYTDLFEIKTQPVDVSVESGHAAPYSVAVAGNGLSYQWQFKLASASGWKNWEGKTASLLKVPYDIKKDGMLVRCVITNDKGEKLTSGEAKLTYKVTVPSINRQPASISVLAGHAGVFSVGASGDTLSFQWQYKLAGAIWKDWAGKTEAILKVPYDAKKDGMSVRCVVTDKNGKKATSRAAVMTYKK